jgi:membrane protein YdbS with pleckstrin-like domain
VKKYKPLIDKLYMTILIIIAVLLSSVTVAAAFAPAALLIVLPIDLFTIYHVISPLFGYVELRESSLYIRYGLILSKEIPYGRIRNVSKGRGFYSESMLSLKNALDHVNIKYNTFDMTTVSVRDNDSFINDLSERI